MCLKLLGKQRKEIGNNKMNNCDYNHKIMIEGSYLDTMVFIADNPIIEEDRWSVWSFDDGEEGIASTLLANTEYHRLNWSCLKEMSSRYHRLLVTVRSITEYPPLGEVITIHNGVMEVRKRREKGLFGWGRG